MVVSGALTWPVHDVVANAVFLGLAGLEDR